MSTEKGNGSRTRPQKYKNRVAFKNDMHDTTPKQIFLNKLQIFEVCRHCKGVIEWKIKYKKYKPLTQPKTCTKCQRRNITKAYHVLCRGCAYELRVCAKCLKSADEVTIEPPQPTPEEEIKLKAEMERLLKCFPERKRRAFLRYMEKGKKEDTDDEKEDRKKEAADENGHNKEVDVQAEKRTPYTRDELLKKLEEMKLGTDDNENFGFSSDDDNSDEYESGE